MKEAGAIIVDPADIPTQRLRRPRVRGAAVRVQGRSQRLPVGTQDPASPRWPISSPSTPRTRRASCRTSARKSWRWPQKKGPLTDPKYRQARATCVRYARTLGIDAVMTRHRLDALVCPTSGPATPDRSRERRLRIRAAAPARPRWPATRTSPSRVGSCSACQSAFRSSAAPGASRRCSSSRTHSSRRRSSGRRRPSRRQRTSHSGGEIRATDRT